MIWKIRHLYWGLRKRIQRFKRGYAWVDVWNFFDWFIETAEPMLRHLSENCVGNPVEYTEEEWSARLKEMADCLHYMDEWNVIDELLDGDYMRFKECSEIMQKNHDRFFELFSADFFNLWD